MLTATAGCSPSASGRMAAEHAVVLADIGAAALRAYSPLAVVLADIDAAALIAYSPLAVVLADPIEAPPHSLHRPRCLS